ncbi:integrin alpha-6 [Hoplias malabaricus]|uniref:integrin alpha-6 n=1 Tax=Hoplias malabaricus TaxID=27720 RepID=UPI003461AF71
MQAGRWTLILGLWLLSDLHPWWTLCFNLDDTNILRKNGTGGSLFGFSLAMHHQLRPTDQQFLLVGAPHAKALPQQKANVTGGLYRCKFSTLTDDCERIPVDAKDEKPGNGKDHRENQWMGVRVRSQGPGGKVVVCAHRYQQWIYASQLVLGRCFILDENLKVDDTRSFCRNRPGDKDLFGYCQQGLSVAFTKDGSYLVFASPGAYDWKGTVRMEPVDNFLLDSFETGDQNEFDEKAIPVGISSYLGFALDSGMNLITKGDQVIVAGAPRSNLSGEVLLLRPKAAEDKRILSVEQIISGPGLASSFGYSLAVLDLNADGWDDLIVGAPQFSLPDLEADVGGAVYVYIHSDGKQDWNHIKPMVLHGNTASMFGLAVADIGDVNHDGYNDFAVGAPYDVDDGAVYIYLGAAGELSTQPQQALKGLTHKIKLFGYSLAGNMDIDGNSYPDLAVGSLSDSVAVFRAKPVINMEKTLTLYPGEIDYYGRDCQKGHCSVRADFCFSFTTYPASYNPRLQILYTLVADEGHFREPPRMTFQTSSKDSLVLPQQGQRICSRADLRLLANINDKLTDIPVSLSVTLSPESPPQSLTQSPLPPLKPTLKSQGPDVISTAKFKFLNTGCGSDGICQSNLQLQYRFCVKDPHQDKCTPLAKEDGMAVISPGEENTALELTVTNKGGDSAHLAQLTADFPGSLPLSSFIPSKNSRVGCAVDGNKTQAECQLGNPLKRDGEVKFYLMLSTERLSPAITDVNMTLNMETISKQNISQVVAMAKVVYEMELQVTGLARPSQVFFGGKVKGENAITSEGEIGSPVLYEFRIINMGRPLKSFASATLNIQWPKENKHGKWLLYLLQVTGPKNQTIPCSPAAEISPLHHIQVASRGKRQVEGEGKLDALSTDGVLSLFGRKRHYQYLTCAEEMKCVELRCPLQAVDSTAAVNFLARVWNSTFVEDYSSLNYLDIVLNASLSLDGSQKNIRLLGSQTQVKSFQGVRLTLFPEKKPTLLSQVPWWVILLSVVLALLLLVLLIYFLSKLGCFTCDMCTEDRKGYYAINRAET